MNYFQTTKTRLTNVIRDWRYTKRLEHILNNNSQPTKSLKDVFGQVDDNFWGWLYTDGYRGSATLRQLLPVLPEERLQLQFTGTYGDNTLKEAFLAYALFKTISEKSGITIQEESRILDFGCGWGRILRFFLKDINASNLYGVDCDSEIIQVCKQSNLRGEVAVISPYPPTHFPAATFDLIYSYSVFSHLAEDIHKQWLQEFQRILKPGGVCIATTRPREFILECAELRKFSDIPDHAKGSTISFLETEQCLKMYDTGAYCFSYTGGDGVREGDFYGETCIPEAYVNRVWTNFFSSVDVLEDREHCCFAQNIIIAKK